MTVKEIIDNVGGGYYLTVNVFSLVLYNGVPTEILVATIDNEMYENFDFDETLEVEDYDITYANENTKEMVLDIYIKSTKEVEINE